MRRELRYSRCATTMVELPPPPPPPPDDAPKGVSWAPHVRSPPLFRRRKASGVPPRPPPPRRRRGGGGACCRPATVGLGVSAALYVVVFVALLSRDPSYDGGAMEVAVLGSMGSGTVATSRRLRALGLDVTHETTAGADGVVSWLHALLYLPPLAGNATDPLCAGSLRNAWHPQLVFAETRRACGEERAATVRGGAGRRAAACWRDACPRRAPRWRGCAAASACPVRFAAKPVVLVRHPLRTVESLVAGFCRGDARFAADSAGEPPNQLKAAARLLAGLDEAALGRESCALGFARYWRAYYAALEPLVAAGAALVRAEDDDYACAIVAAVAARAPPAPRLDRAAAACGSDGAMRLARTWVHRLRGAFEAAGEDGPLRDHENRRNGGGVRATWRAIGDADRDLAVDMLRLAKAFGYVATADKSADGVG